MMDQLVVSKILRQGAMPLFPIISEMSDLKVKINNIIILFITFECSPEKFHCVELEVFSRFAARLCILLRCCQSKDFFFHICFRLVNLHFLLSCNLNLFSSKFIYPS